MGITLLDLVEELKAPNIEYACFDWSAEFGEMLMFSSGTTYIENERLKVVRGDNNVAKPYEDLMMQLLREKYPHFDFEYGSYGEMYVHSTGRIEIHLTKRIQAEEYHTAIVDLSTHSSVG